MLNEISILFGGRIAEDLFVKKISTGASNDYERATKIARDMVTRYGMSAELGPMVYAENEGEVFLGRSVTKTTHISEATMQKVDAEIRRILDEQYAIAQNILENNRDKMEAMMQALMQWETIDRDQVLEIMAGKQPSPPKDYSHNVRGDNGADVGNTEATDVGETDQPVGESAPALADEAAEQDQIATPLNTQTAEEAEQQEAAADKQT